MADFRIGVSSALHRPDGEPAFPSYDLSPLQAQSGVELVRYDSERTLPAATLAGLDAIILLGERITPASFPGDGRLAQIARMGVGYDTVDVAACTANDVALTTTPGAVRRPMAVATLTYLLALAGNMMVKDRLTRQGPAGWAQRGRHHGVGLVGRTLGMVGIGNIGAEVLRLAAPLEMRHIAHDPYANPRTAAELGVELVSLDEVFRQSDFLSLNCPLTPETRHLVNSATLALMKPTAYLINTARGGVVDQQALYAALADRRIAGAGLDVLDPEPSAENEPIHALDNVILAPHALGWTDQMFATMAEINVADLRAVMRGETPENVVNRDVLEQPGFVAKLAARGGR